MRGRDGGRLGLFALVWQTNTHDHAHPLQYNIHPHSHSCSYNTHNHCHTHAHNKSSGCVGGMGAGGGCLIERVAGFDRNPFWQGPRQLAAGPGNGMMQ